jgi:hypothetical protein
MEYSQPLPRGHVWVSLPSGDCTYRIFCKVCETCYVFYRKNSFLSLFSCISGMKIEWTGVIVEFEVEVQAEDGVCRRTHFDLGTRSKIC